MLFYDVRVDPDSRWDRVQVGGREFTKLAPVRLSAAALTEEIRNAPLLAVTAVAELVPPAPAGDQLVAPAPVGVAEASAASEALPKRRKSKEKGG